MMSTIAPAIWVAYEIPEDEYHAWCTDNVCDWQSGDGNYWQVAWNRMVGGAGYRFGQYLAHTNAAPARAGA